MSPHQRRLGICAAICAIFLLAASLVYRNVEEAREAAERLAMMQQVSKGMQAIPSFLAPGSAIPSKANDSPVHPDVRSGPLLESERMERQMVLDSYEQARQQLQANPDDPLIRMLYGSAEVAKRMSDIQWQKRLENLR